jgi:NDP-sugar pyrophosphorylase family protein
MKAVILAGGQGTRLRPYTFVVPKPLLPVGQKPVLQIIVEHLRAHEITEIVVALGYLGDLVRAFLGDGSRFGVGVTYIEETKPLGTAGPLRLLQDRLVPDELVLLMNGDILTKLDFSAVVRKHDPATVDISMGVKRLEEQSPYGVLEIENGTIRRVIEKPVRSEYINAGIYLVNQRTLSDIPEESYYTMPDLVNERLRQGHAVQVFEVNEPWLAVEDPQHLEAANFQTELWATP